MHPNQQNLTPEEIEAQLTEKGEYMKLYGGLLKFGIDLFEPDGTANGGMKYMLLLLSYFEKIESYGRCGRIRDWMKEYRKRWPYIGGEFIVTPEQEANINLSAYYIGYYKKLRRYGMKSFDEQGQVILVDKESGKKELTNGRKFLMEALTFFQKKDQPYAYRICAELQALLDEYDKTYPKN